MQWFRFYTETLNNPKVQKLDGETFKSWVNILCFAAQNDGVICDGNSDVTDLAFALRMENNGVLTLLERLHNATLIDKVNGGVNGWHYAPRDWNKYQYKSDTSTERTKRFRERSRNVTVTPPEQIQNRTEQSIPKPLSENFETFWKKFPTQRKGNRDAALKSWNRATQRADEQTILRGLEAYLGSDEVADGYAKGAAAWLNDDRWASDYKPPKQTTVKIQPAMAGVGVL